MKFIEKCFEKKLVKITKGTFVENWRNPRKSILRDPLEIPAQINNGISLEILAEIAPEVSPEISLHFLHVIPPRVPIGIPFVISPEIFQGYL